MTTFTVESTRVIGAEESSQLDEYKKREIEAALRHELTEQGEEEVRQKTGSKTAAVALVDPGITFTYPPEGGQDIIVQATGSVVGVTYPSNLVTSLPVSGGRGAIASSPAVTIEQYNVAEQTALLSFSFPLTNQIANPAPVFSLSPALPAGTAFEGNTEELSAIIPYPEEIANAACYNKATGARCQFSFSEVVFSGTCSVFTGEILTCVPDTR